MYKLICSNITRSHKSLTNFTGYYKKVAEKCNKGTSARKKFVSETDLPRQAIEESSEPVECQEEALDPDVAINRKPISCTSFFNQESRQTLLLTPENKVEHTRFFHSTNKRVKQVGEKPFRDKKAEEYYQTAMEQCMKIRKKLDKIYQAASFAPQTPRPISEIKRDADNLEPKSIEIQMKPKMKPIPPKRKEKPPPEPSPEKKTSKWHKPHYQFRENKTSIKYPTHTVRYKLGTYHLEHSVKMTKKKATIEKRKPVIKDPFPEPFNTNKVTHEKSTEDERATLQQLKQKTRKQQPHLATLLQQKHIKENKEKKHQGKLEDGMIKQHPTVQTANSSVRMAFKNRYNKLLQRSGLLYQALKNREELPSKEQEDAVTKDADRDKKRTASRQPSNLKINDGRQRTSETDLEPKMIKHPMVSTKQERKEISVKNPKRILCDKYETYDIDATCIKSNNVGTAHKENFGDYVVESEEKVKNFVDSYKQEPRMRHIETMTREEPPSQQSAKEEASSTMNSIREYLKKLKALRDQTAVQKSENIKQPDVVVESKKAQEAPKKSEQRVEKPADIEAQPPENYSVPKDLNIKRKEYPIYEDFNTSKDSDSYKSKAEQVVRQIKPKVEKARSQSVANLRPAQSPAKRAIPIKPIQSENFNKNANATQRTPNENYPQEKHTPRSARIKHSERVYKGTETLKPVEKVKKPTRAAANKEEQREAPWSPKVTKPTRIQRSFQEKQTKIKEMDFKEAQAESTVAPKRMTNETCHEEKQLPKFTDGNLARTSYRKEDSVEGQKEATEFAKKSEEGYLEEKHSNISVRIKLVREDQQNEAKQQQSLEERDAQNEPPEVTKTVRQTSFFKDQPRERQVPKTAEKKLTEQIDSKDEASKIGNEPPEAIQTSSFKNQPTEGHVPKTAEKKLAEETDSKDEASKMGSVPPGVTKAVRQTSPFTNQLKESHVPKTTEKKSVEGTDSKDKATKMGYEPSEVAKTVRQTSFFKNQPREKHILKTAQKKLAAAAVSKDEAEEASKIRKNVRQRRKLINESHTFGKSEQTGAKKQRKDASENLSKIMARYKVPPKIDEKMSEAQMRRLERKRMREEEKRLREKFIAKQSILEAEKKAIENEENSALKRKYRYKLDEVQLEPSKTEEQPVLETLQKDVSAMTDEHEEKVPMESSEQPSDRIGDEQIAVKDVEIAVKDVGNAVKDVEIAVKDVGIATEEKETQKARDISEMATGIIAKNKTLKQETKENVDEKSTTLHAVGANVSKENVGDITKPSENNESAPSQEKKLKYRNALEDYIPKETLEKIAIQKKLLEEKNAQLNQNVVEVVEIEARSIKFESPRHFEGTKGKDPGEKKSTIEDEVKGKKSEEASSPNEDCPRNRLTKHQLSNLMKLKEAGSQIIELVKQIDDIHILKVQRDSGKSLSPENRPTIRRERQEPNSKDKSKKERPKSNKDIVFPPKGHNEPKLQQQRCTTVSLPDHSKNALEVVNESITTLPQRKYELMPMEQTQKCKSLAALAIKQKDKILKEIEDKWNEENGKTLDRNTGLSKSEVTLTLKEEQQELEKELGRAALDVNKRKYAKEYGKNIKKPQKKQTSVNSDALKRQEEIQKRKLIVNFRVPNLLRNIRIKTTEETGKTGTTTSGKFSNHTTQHQEDTNTDIKVQGTSILSTPNIPQLDHTAGSCCSSRNYFGRLRRGRIEDDTLRVDLRLRPSTGFIPKDVLWHTPNDLDKCFSKIKKGKIEDDFLKASEGSKNAYNIGDSQTKPNSVIPASELMVYRVEKIKSNPDFGTDPKALSPSSNASGGGNRVNSQDVAWHFGKRKRARIEDDKVKAKPVARNASKTPASVDIIGQLGDIGMKVVQKIEAKIVGEKIKIESLKSDVNTKPTDTKRKKDQLITKKAHKSASRSKLQDNQQETTEERPKTSPASAIRKKHNKSELTSIASNKKDKDNVEKTSSKQEKVKTKHNMKKLLEAMKKADKDLEEVLKAYEVYTPQKKIESKSKKDNKSQTQEKGINLTKETTDFSGDKAKANNKVYQSSVDSKTFVVTEKKRRSSKRKEQAKATDSKLSKGRGNTDNKLEKMTAKKTFTKAPRSRQNTKSTIERKTRKNMLSVEDEKPKKGKRKASKDNKSDVKSPRYLLNSGDVKSQTKQPRKNELTETKQSLKEVVVKVKDNISAKLEKLNFIKKKNLLTPQDKKQTNRLDSVSQVKKIDKPVENNKELITEIKEPQPTEETPKRTFDTKLILQSIDGKETEGSKIIVTSNDSPKQDLPPQENVIGVAQEKEAAVDIPGKRKTNVTVPTVKQAQVSTSHDILTPKTPRWRIRDSIPRDNMNTKLRTSDKKVRFTDRKLTTPNKMPNKKHTGYGWLKLNAAQENSYNARRKLELSRMKEKRKILTPLKLAEYDKPIKKLNSGSKPEPNLNIKPNRPIKKAIFTISRSTIFDILSKPKHKPPIINSKFSRKKVETLYINANLVTNENSTSQMNLIIPNIATEENGDAALHKERAKSLQNLTKTIKAKSRPRLPRKNLQSLPTKKKIHRNKLKANPPQSDVKKVSSEKLENTFGTDKEVSTGSLSLSCLECTASNLDRDSKRSVSKSNLENQSELVKVKTVPQFDVGVNNTENTVKETIKLDKSSNIRYGGGKSIHKNEKLITLMDKKLSNELHKMLVEEKSLKNEREKKFEDEFRSEVTIDKHVRSDTGINRNTEQKSHKFYNDYLDNAYKKVKQILTVAHNVDLGKNEVNTKSDKKYSPTDSNDNKKLEKHKKTAENVNLTEKKAVQSEKIVKQETTEGNSIEKNLPNKKLKEKTVVIAKEAKTLHTKNKKRKTNVQKSIRTRNNKNVDNNKSGSKKSNKTNNNTSEVNVISVKTVKSVENTKTEPKLISKEKEYKNSDFKIHKNELNTQTQSSIELTSIKTTKPTKQHKSPETKLKSITEPCLTVHKSNTNDDKNTYKYTSQKIRQSLMTNNLKPVEQESQENRKRFRELGEDKVKITLHLKKKPKIDDEDKHFQLQVKQKAVTLNPGTLRFCKSKDSLGRPSKRMIPTIEVIPEENETQKVEEAENKLAIRQDKEDCNALIVTNVKPSYVDSSPSLQTTSKISVQEEDESRKVLVMYTSSKKEYFKDNSTENKSDDNNKRFPTGQACGTQSIENPKDEKMKVEQQNQTESNIKLTHTSDCPNRPNEKRQLPKMSYEEFCYGKQSPLKARIEQIFLNHNKEIQKIYKFNKTLIKHIQENQDKHRLTPTSKALLDPKTKDASEMQKMLQKFLKQELRKPYHERITGYSLLTKYNKCTSVALYSNDKNQNVTEKSDKGGEKELPKKASKIYIEKTPPNRYKTEERKEQPKPVPRTCERIRLPLQNVTQVIQKQPIEETNTLNKDHTEKIQVVPKTIPGIDKYKGSNISLISIKQSKRMSGENFLPVLLSHKSISRPKTANSMTNLDMTKKQILEFRYELLQKLNKEFTALCQQDFNQNKGKFEKVSQYYKKVTEKLKKEDVLVKPQTKSIDELLGPCPMPSFERVCRYYNMVVQKGKDNGETKDLKATNSVVLHSKNKNNNKAVEQMMKSKKDKEDGKEPENKGKHS